MKIRIIAVGKIKKSPEKELIDYYSKISKWATEIIEVEVKNFSNPEHRRELEAAEILKHTEGHTLFPLEERGKQLDSIEFAALIQKELDSGRVPCFIIGGADGLHTKVTSIAKNIISFGKMTMPHMLVRAVLAEQIYRAGTIISNHPYHK